MLVFGQNFHTCLGEHAFLIRPVGSPGIFDVLAQIASHVVSSSGDFAGSIETSSLAIAIVSSCVAGRGCLQVVVFDATSRYLFKNDPYSE